MFSILWIYYDRVILYCADIWNIHKDDQCFCTYLCRNNIREERWLGLFQRPYWSCSHEVILVTQFFNYLTICSAAWPVRIVRNIYLDVLMWTDMRLHHMNGTFHIKWDVWWWSIIINSGAELFLHSFTSSSQREPLSSSLFINIFSMVLNFVSHQANQ